MSFSRADNRYNYLTAILINASSTFDFFNHSDRDEFA